MNRSSILSSVKTNKQYCVCVYCLQDIELADLDMMLPGATAKFTWFDMLMVGPRGENPLRPLLGTIVIRIGAHPLADTTQP